MNDHPNVDERAWILLNLQIDGELSDIEKQELQALLDSSEEVRTAQSTLESLNSCLQQVPDKVPPAYLHNAIISTVRLPVQTTGSNEKKGIGSWLTKNWLGPAFALTAGVLLTVGVYETNPDSVNAVDTARMTGTMMQTGSSTKGLLLDRIEVGDQRVSSTAVLHQSGPDFVVSVQVDSESPVKFTLDYAANGLELMGVTSSKSQVGAMSANQNQVTVEGQGEQEYTLMLRSMGEQLTANTVALTFTLLDKNGQSFEAELKTGR